ncbi:DUF4956 domain-containing protein [Candidatus Pelagibacter sp.]|nr:DUF4956 domain-containing protein [Candidatus Pelagibacter sp.]
MNDLMNNQELQSFFFNSNVEIDLLNFFYAIILSLILSFLVKITYIKVGKSLNDKSYFSDTFIPLALITTLVITVIKFSLALSLGLVGALSIVRFRAAIKEPEELVYLFFVISIGLSNGANQFLLSIFASLVIIGFLFGRYIFENKFKKDNQFTLDSNILNINIFDNDKKDIKEITSIIENKVEFLKLKSANIEDKTSSYIFWYNLSHEKLDEFLDDIKNLSDKNVNISIYSKSNAHE